MPRPSRKIIKIEYEGMLVDAKTCTKCDEVKPLDEFRIDKNRKDGRGSHCKACIKKSFDSWYVKNKERVLNNSKNYYQSNKEEKMEYSSQYRKENIEKAREWSRRSYSNNKEKYKDKRKVYMSTWEEEFPEKKYKNRILSREFGSELHYILNKDEFASFQKGKCCLTYKRTIVIDHFIPMSIGHGGTYIGNLVKLNRELNASKANKNPFEWIKTKPNYHTEFIIIVNELSTANGLTTEEFEKFIFWCFSNQRSKEEVIKDNRFSIEIWRAQTQKQFPLPSYCYREGESVNEK